MPLLKMDDTTQHIEKPKQKRDSSHFFGLSARAAIALILVVTVCVMSYQGKSVEEPLKVLVVSVVSFYVGTKNAPATPKP